MDAVYPIDSPASQIQARHVQNVATVVDVRCPDNFSAKAQLAGSLE